MLILFLCTLLLCTFMYTYVYVYPLSYNYCYTINFQRQNIVLKNIQEIRRTTENSTGSTRLLANYLSMICLIPWNQENTTIYDNTNGPWRILSISVSFLLILLSNMRKRDACVNRDPAFCGAFSPRMLSILVLNNACGICAMAQKRDGRAGAGFTL